jgi:hypothetical protein
MMEWLALQLEWLTSQSPAWIFMIFPVIFGIAFLSALNDVRKEKKLEGNPHNMDEEEYEQHNRTRFRK